MDNLDIDKGNRTIEEDPHITNSQSEIFNNTKNMHQSANNQSLNANVSRVKFEDQPKDENKFQDSVEKKDHEKIKELQNSVIILKQVWEKEISKIKVKSHNFNDTFEQEIEASVKNEKIVDVSNDFMLLNNDCYELPEEPSKIDIPIESIEAFNKEDFKNLSFFKEN